MKKISMAFLLLAALILAACTNPQTLPRQRVLRDGLMDTIMLITAYGEGAQEAVGAAFERIETIHRVADVNDPYGLTALMSVRGFADAEYLELLEISRHAYDITGGAFNPALGPLINLWDIGTENERVPADDEINAALALSSFDDVAWDSFVRLRYADMQLNFGGVAKGYAADEAAQILRGHGIEHALLDLGGDIYALGTRPDGNPWRIGIRSPLGDGAVIGIVELSDTSAMTSGSYIRYFEQDGRRYHHIFDPQTGRPADSGLLSVTVIYENAALADAVSTAFFVLGIERSAAILQDIPEMSVIFITDELEIYLIGGQAQAFSLTDDRFRIIS